MNTRDLSMLLAAAGAAVVLAQPAAAQSASAKAKVDAAKAQGVVGEQADGFLGFVGNADTETRAAVAEINAGRAQVYREAAARNGTAPEAAGASAFSNYVFPRLPAGQYYRAADGSWKRK